MDDLRPCPFCASSGIFWDRGGMECPACAARGPANEKRRVCVSAWNTRPVEDALTAQLAQAQAEVGRLRIGIEHLLMSADCTWEERGEGHDWREAVQEARALLTPPAAPEADTP